MTAAPFSDKYHLRHVAGSSLKACFICYKPTDAVLVSQDGKSDFFYVCEAHLSDPSFAVPDVNPELEKAKAKQNALQAEIEVVKKQWELYQSKKKDKNSKEKDDDKEKDKEENKNKDKDKDSSPKDKLDQLEKQKSQADDAVTDSKPRKYTLNKDIYRLRLQTWKSVQAAKQTRQLLQKPSLFPTVPKSAPGLVPNSPAGSDKGSDDADKGPDQGPSPGA